MGTLNVNNINGAQLGGFRNLIINGNFQVNQRVAASRTATSSAYNYDRWYYDGTDLYQVIEGQDIRAVEHAISWSGSGLTAAWVSSANTTASIPTGFTSILNGSTFTPTANTNLWIKFSGTVANLANLAEVQVEAGSTATAFEHRPYGVELMLCQRYFQTYRGVDTQICNGGMGASTSFVGVITYVVEMRSTPTFSASSGTDFFRVYTTTGSNPTTVSTNILAGTKTMSINATTPDSLTDGHAGNIRCYNADAQINFSSEL